MYLLFTNLNIFAALSVPQAMGLTKRLFQIIPMKHKFSGGVLWNYYIEKKTVKL